MLVHKLSKVGGYEVHSGIRQSDEYAECRRGWVTGSFEWCFVSCKECFKKKPVNVSGKGMKHAEWILLNNKRSKEEEATILRRYKYNARTGRITRRKGNKRYKVGRERVDHDAELAWLDICCFYGHTNYGWSVVVYLCDLCHKLVEAGGMWHCPNSFCDGPGAGYFRSRLDSYMEQYPDDRHTVDELEWRRESLLDLKLNHTWFFQQRVCLQCRPESNPYLPLEACKEKQGA